MGLSINDVGNERGGGEGSKIGQNCQRIVLKICQYEGGGCQKSGKIADVVYGWSLGKKHHCLCVIRQNVFDLKKKLTL